MKFFPDHIILNGNPILVGKYINAIHSAPHEASLAEFLKEWYSPDDFIMVQTSGSTGTPKNIKLKKEFTGHSALRTIRHFNLTENDNLLHCLPVKYIAGKLMVVRALVAQSNLVTVDPTTNFQFLQHSKFKFAAMVPHQVHKILQAEPAKGVWMQNIDNLLIGGSALPYSLEVQLQEIPTSCWLSYAMTETATHIALRKINSEEIDEYYHCMDDITVQASNDGCLQIFMPGLKEQPLQTNDLAEIRDEKTFKILGRADHVIISGGIKYCPELLEKKLESFLTFPYLISSVPHPTLGRQLVIVVEGEKSAAVENQIKHACNIQLEKYERPRQIYFITEIPKTENGKYDRKTLERLISVSLLK